MKQPGTLRVGLFSRIELVAGCPAACVRVLYGARSDRWHILRETGRGCASAIPISDTDPAARVRNTAV